MAIKYTYSGSFFQPDVDPDAQAYFDALDTAGYPVSDPYKIMYSDTIIALKAALMWDELDCLFIDATGDKQWALVDVKNPSRTATIVNGYSGDWTIGLGFKGNGSNFGITTGYNPTVGTNKFLQDDASYGVLLLDDNSVSPVWDIGATDTGLTGGNFIRSYSNAQNAGCVNAIYVGSNTYKKPILNSYCWLSMNRTGATTTRNYLNGVNIESGTQASQSILNLQFGRFGLYKGTFQSSFFSSNTQACFYAGSGSVSQKEMINALNANFFVPQATKAAITKRIIFEGDSRTGDASSSSFSNLFAMPKRALTNLGDNWGGAAVSTSNDTAQNMVSQYATEVAPYLNADFVENVFVLWAGTNDIANGRTAAQIKTDLETIGQYAKDDGFKVIIVGEIDRNWGSYAAMNTVRATLRTNMLADFGVSTTEANVTTPASVTYADYYIDLYAETNFQSYVSAWYQVDGIHPNTTGSQIVGDYVSATILI